MSAQIISLAEVRARRDIDKYIRCAMSDEYELVPTVAQSELPLPYVEAERKNREKMLQFVERLMAGET